VLIIAMLIGLKTTPVIARDITTIIVHHSGVDKNQTVEQIRRYHVDVRGWDDIGYHYVIYRDGSIHKGRPEAIQGAHAFGRNADSIGICLIGDKIITSKQTWALRNLIRAIMTRHEITSIERHHERCPSSAVDVERLQKELIDNQHKQ